MKHLLILSFSFLITATVSAQNFKLKDIQDLRDGTLIVGLSGNDTVDTYFKEAIEKYWSFKEVSEYLPVEEAMTKAKKDKQLFVLHIGSGASVGPVQGSSFTFQYRYVSVGRRIMISSGKSFSKPEAYTYFPTFGKQGNVKRESLLFAMAAMQHICSTMDEDDIKSLLKWEAIFNKYTDELENKTVYLKEDWLDGKLTEKEIQEIYPYPIEVVSEDKWLNAVSSKNENLVYVIIVPIPQAGSYTYVHYFMLSGEPKIMGTAYSKFNVQVMGNNVTAANMGYIIERNVKLYAKMVK